MYLHVFLKMEVFLGCVYVDGVVNGVLNIGHCVSKWIGEEKFAYYSNIFSRQKKNELKILKIENAKKNEANINDIDIDQWLCTQPDDG